MFGKNSLLPPRRSLSCLVFALIGGLLSLFLILQLVFNIFLPWFPPHATVTLIPRSQVAQNTLLLSADHVHARQILATASPQSATGSTAGTIPATNARGTLTFLNQTDVDVTIQSAVITNKNGIQIRFTGPLLIPATTHNASATTTGIAVQAGASGNIPACSCLNGDTSSSRACVMGCCWDQQRTSEANLNAVLIGNDSTLNRHIHVRLIEKGQCPPGVGRRDGSSGAASCALR